MLRLELKVSATLRMVDIVSMLSVEQHGPHLATGVDIVLGTGIAQATARRIAAAGQPVVVTPCVWTGLAEHHVAFGGTVTLDYAAFAAVLRGVVRSEDVMANNTIFSYNIAEATIKYVSSGTISDNQRKGWFTKIWEKVTPF